MNKLFLGMTTLIFGMALSACTADSSKHGLMLSGSSPSIVNGERAQETSDVAASTLFVLTSRGDDNFVCTGTLVSKDLVVTAAHCLEDASDVYVYFGTGLPESAEDVIPAIKVMMHPEYQTILDADGNEVTTVNDIGLLKIPAPPADRHPVPVLSASSTLQPYQQLLLAGYGIVDEMSDPPEQGTGLDFVRATLVKVDSSLLILDQANGGACVGDSGGPAYLETAQGLVLVGATRGPHGVATDCRHLSDFTSVSYFQKFILAAAPQLGAEAPQFIDLAK